MDEDNNQEEVKNIEDTNEPEVNNDNTEPQNEEKVEEETAEPQIEEMEKPKVMKTEENVFMPKKKGMHRAYLSENSVKETANEQSDQNLGRNRSSMLCEGGPNGYGNKLYKNQSASTLTHSICSYTIPKQERFDRKSYCSLNDNIYNIKTTISSRGPYIGYGNRERYSKSYLQQISNQPSPQQYINQSEFDANRKAKTFGIGYKHYARAIPSGIKNYRPIEEANRIPGPGLYFQRKKSDKPEDFAPFKPKYTMVAKGKMAAEIITEISPGAVYKTKFNLVEGTRFSSGTSFGYGNKSDITHVPSKENPGPGSYKLPTIFSKYQSK